MITIQDYRNFIFNDQYKWSYAVDRKQLLPVEWRTLTYKICGADEAEEKQYAQYFKFSRAMCDKWLSLQADDKSRPILNVVKTKDYLTVCYTVWNGRVFMPSDKANYQNLPVLNNCTIGTAIQNGLISQVAENQQFKVVEMIWTTLQLQQNRNN